MFLVYELLLVENEELVLSNSVASEYIRETFTVAKYNWILSMYVISEMF